MDSGADGFKVAHFADQDHVRILTERGAQSGRERRCVHFDLALVDVAFLVAVQEFDWVFDGDDMLGAGGVDAIDHGSERGGLARAGDARNQDEAARHVANLLNDFWQVEFIERADLGGNDSEHQSHVAALLKDVYTEAAQSGHAVGHVDFGGLFELLLLARRHHAERHSQHVLGSNAGLVGQRMQFAVDAQVRVVSDLQVQVGRASLHRNPKQVINIHSTRLP